MNLRLRAINTTTLDERCAVYSSTQTSVLATDTLRVVLSLSHTIQTARCRLSLSFVAPPPTSAPRRLNLLLRYPSQASLHTHHQSRAFADLLRDPTSLSSSASPCARRAFERDGTTELARMEGRRSRTVLHPRRISTGRSRPYIQARKGEVCDSRTMWKARLLWVRAAVPRQRPSEDAQRRR
jgi:hypothetical protein